MFENLNSCSTEGNARTSSERITDFVNIRIEGLGRYRFLSEYLKDSPRRCERAKSEIAQAVALELKASLNVVQEFAPRFSVSELVIGFTAGNRREIFDRCVASLELNPAQEKRLELVLVPENSSLWTSKLEDEAEILENAAKGLARTDFQRLAELAPKMLAANQEINFGKLARLFAKCLEYHSSNTRAYYPRQSESLLEDSKKTYQDVADSEIEDFFNGLLLDLDGQPKTPGDAIFLLAQKIIENLDPKYSDRAVSVLEDFKWQRAFHDSLKPDLSEARSPKLPQEPSYEILRSTPKKFIRLIARASDERLAELAVEISPEERGLIYDAVVESEQVFSMEEYRRIRDFFARAVYNKEKMTDRAWELLIERHLSDKPLSLLLNLAIIDLVDNPNENREFFPQILRAVFLGAKPSREATGLLYEKASNDQLVDIVRDRGDNPATAFQTMMQITSLLKTQQKLISFLEACFKKNENVVIVGHHRNALVSFNDFFQGLDSWSQASAVSMVEDSLKNIRLACYLSYHDFIYYAGRSITARKIALDILSNRRILHSGMESFASSYKHHFSKSQVNVSFDDNLYVSDTLSSPEFLREIVRGVLFGEGLLQENCSIIVDYILSEAATQGLSTEPLEQAWNRFFLESV